MPNVFSKATLGKFEDASASIFLRQLDGAFERAGLRPGKDPGGDEGTRKSQFRRYVAAVDQRDLQQLERLGYALGALIACVATSKEEFLIRAAESDGFVFEDGAFRLARTARHSAIVTRAEDLTSVDERGRRLYRLGDERPAQAIDEAAVLVDSLCRTVLRIAGRPAPEKNAPLADVVAAALAAAEPMPVKHRDGKRFAAASHDCARALGVLVAASGAKSGVSPRHARLATGAAVAIANFVAQTYLHGGRALDVDENAGRKTR